MKHRQGITHWLLVGFALLGSASATLRAADPPSVDFAREVRPILSDRCFPCHGPDEQQRQADLRLDLADAATRELPSGRRAIVPHEPLQSELWRRITAADPEHRMPPVEVDKPITDAEQEILRRWIVAGADYQQHWAWLPPQRPPVPPVTGSGGLNPIDRFVLAALTRQGISPSPSADRATLLRRVTQDLTGLPPTPAELRAFLADPSPDAYERLVDRLLQSPRYGEHRARYWLDAARYGDTHGLHLDNERSLWPYRDWVIDAFNRNQPFDQFTIEQLAGDLLPNASLDQRVATGFHRCNVTTSEGGAIDDEFLARYAMDRVETTATVWLGLTAGCAACHDHKYDPISQREYYQLYAFFYSLTEQAMDGNALLPPPAVRVPSVAQAARLQQVQANITQTQQDMESRRRQVADAMSVWQAELRREFATTPADDWIVSCALDDGLGEQVAAGRGQLGRLVGSGDWDAARWAGGLRLNGQGHVDLGDLADFEHSDPFSLAAWVYLDADGQMTILSRMDDDNAFRGYDLYCDQRHVYFHLIHRWEEDALRVRTRLPIRKQKWQHVAVTYDGSRHAAGVTIYLDGVEQELERTHDQLQGTVRTDEPLRLGQRRRAAPWIGMLDEVHVYARRLSAEEVQTLAQADPLAALLALPVELLTDDQRQSLEEQVLLRRDSEYRALQERQRMQREELRRVESQFASSLVMEELSKPRQAYRLTRGQYDQPAEPVAPAVPAAWSGWQPAWPANRLGLAQWVVAPEHPLTARVTVNRIWQQFFGTGIVATPEDFGSQGAWPSHPELLDWLAVELRESGWDVKHVIRLIVTSATYQQSSAASVESLTRDPQNVWLGRFPRYRWDAEQVRDQALSVSGLLVERTGGRSVKPYQPPGLWEAIGYTTSNTAKFVRDEGESLYRRSLYTFWKRTSPPPAMQILDAPSREVCTVRRPRTNTPAAALLLMNDVQMVEAARQLATRVLREGGRTDAERLEYAWLLCTARSPQPSETAALQRLLDDLRGEYQHDRRGAELLIAQGASLPPTDLAPGELASWTVVASTLLNLDEVLTKH